MERCDGCDRPADVRVPLWTPDPYGAVPAYCLDCFAVWQQDEERDVLPGLEDYRPSVMMEVAA